MSSFVSVAFPNSQAKPFRVYKLSYRQKNYAHDYGKVYFRDWGIDPKIIKPGSLMKINLSGKEYVGYVHDIKAHKDNNKDFTEVGFIGASYVMRQASQQIYKNMTAPEIVKKIAVKYGFSYKVINHPRVYSQVSQGGMTDWELMVKLAKECGYFLKAESTSIFFQPFLQDFDELISETRTFSKSDAGFKGLSPLYSFTPLIGETLAHPGADKSAISIAGVDAVTGKPFKVTKQKRTVSTRAVYQPEFFDAHATDVVSPNYATAVLQANSQDEKSKFAYVAEAEVIGTADLKPGLPVYLENIGKSYTGYWTVLEVEHVVIEEQLNFHTFSTRIVVGADSLGDPATGKYPTKPSATLKRHLAPNIRNTRIKPKNVVKTPTITVKPTKTINLVKRINRAGASGAAVSSAAWSSDSGNLISKQGKPGRSAAAVAKVVSYFGRQ